MERAASGGAVYLTPEPEGAQVWFFTRRGGVSEPPYDTLNVSRKVGDEENSVAENLDLIREAMDGRPSAWVRQVAGDAVVRVREAGFAGVADGLVTGEEGFSLVVAVADCAPVALVGERGVGMAHAGWRGALSGVAGKTARGLEDSDLHAYLGPCIRECCYEVSEEISRALDLHDPLPGRYTLEVSSPGLERSLRRPEHFRLSVGRKAMVKTREPLRGTSHRLDGVIVGARDGLVELEVGSGEVVQVPFEDIKAARTVFEWS